MKYEYPVVIRKDDNGTYWAEFPDLNGCFSQGSSYEETVKNAKEALQLFLFPPCIFELTVKPKANELPTTESKIRRGFLYKRWRFTSASILFYEEYFYPFLQKTL